MNDGPTQRLLHPSSILGFAGLLTTGWAAGRLLGDGSYGSALLFYIPTVAVIAFWAAALWPLRRRPTRWLAILAICLLAAHFLSSEIHSPRPQPAGDDKVYTLVHWNVFRNFLPWGPKIRRLREAQADIYVFNELPRQVTRGNWALKLGPGMDYAQAQLMIVACRGQITKQYMDLVPGLIAFWVHCTIDDRPLTILAVDMDASLEMARDPVLAALVDLIEKRRPDLIAGDFNAPRRSRRLQPLPQGYAHAYESVGGGWPYTWPVPFPMLAIDQCITGPGIRPLEHRYVSTLSSDHRLQILRFALDG